MLLKLICHVALEIPDHLVMRINEHSVPRRVQATLIEAFAEEPSTLEELPQRVFLLDEVGEKVSLTLGPVEWCGDFILRAFREIREAAAEVRIVADDGEMSASVVDARSRR